MNYKKLSTNNYSQWISKAIRYKNPNTEQICSNQTDKLHSQGIILTKKQQIKTYKIQSFTQGKPIIYKQASLQDINKHEFNIYKIHNSIRMIQFPPKLTRNWFCRDLCLKGRTISEFNIRLTCKMKQPNQCLIKLILIVLTPT